MKFAIRGADATTGKERQITVEADDQHNAIALAKSHGIFPTQVDALLGPLVQPSPPAPTQSVSSQPASSSNPLEPPMLSVVFTVIAFLEFVAAVLCGTILGSKNALTGWLLFSSGILGGLFLLALAQILQRLYEAVQLLKTIGQHLEAKK